MILREENFNENAHQESTESDTEKTATDVADDNKQDGNGDAAAGALVDEEEREEGVVKLQVYQAYWRAVGHCLAPAVLVAMLCMQGMYTRSCCTCLAFTSFD